jgi:hypothetical protein
LLLLVTAPLVVEKCPWQNAGIFSRLAMQSSSSTDGEHSQFNSLLRSPLALSLCFIGLLWCSRYQGNGAQCS